MSYLLANELRKLMVGESIPRGHSIESTTEQIRSDISGKYPHAKYIYIDVRPGN